MAPTYSFSEVKHFIRSFNLDETNILCEVVNEEFDCYEVYEIRAINRMILLRKKMLNRNEVKLEYLLAYN